MEERNADHFTKEHNSKDELEIRKEKVIKFLEQKKEWIYYFALSFIVFLTVYIRTRNVPRLKDVTTGTWTLGPDLDPFLFLRWAKHIVENGSLMMNDFMRYVPLGYNTAGEMKLLSYMIAWLHYLLSFFSKDVTLTYSAVLFPVVMAGLTAIAFFLFANKIFYKEDKKIRNIIALIATAFFVLVPSMLPRTIAGIPEKESAAFFFMFMAFYLFLESFTSKKLNKGLMFGTLAGISTGLMGLIWGGVIFVFLTIPPAFLLAFVFGKIGKKEFYFYSSWVVSSLILMMLFSTRYSLKILIGSTSTGLAIGIGFIIGMSLFLIMNNKLLKKIKIKSKLSDEVFSIIISLIILIIAILIVFGPSFLYGQISNVISDLIVPVSDRFGMTVAENRQPYFAGEWSSNFGPILFNIPLYFWLFFIGSVTLFYNLIKTLSKKEKRILTLAYFVFLSSLIFSRYSPNSILNGVSGLSLFVYFGGWIFFLGSFGYFYYKRFQKGEHSIFKNLDFSYLLYFVVFTLGIIGARGGIRLIMVLGAVSPIAVSFLIVNSSRDYFKKKEGAGKFFIGIVVLLIVLAGGFTLWEYYKSDKAVAETFAPGVYQLQWQKAMGWVRENTEKPVITEQGYSGPVFAHWWDYGYWIQSIGERATILDGGNTIGYWNYLMGRHVLTGSDERAALEFLYAHNGTHLLIDSTEIGKYTAFSSIGSDDNYDRFSWISTFMLDARQTQETNNQTLYVYTGGASLDEDLVWEENGTEVFLPKRVAGIGAVVLRVNSNNEVFQSEGVFVYNGKQLRIPLKFVYLDGKLYEFESGLDAGVFIFPRLDPQEGGRVNINKIGAMFYLSPRTIHSQIADKYLFNQESDYFKLVHTESNLLIENLRQQGQELGEFVYYQGFQGPIKIWEINYPGDIEFNQEFLSKNYPLNLRTSKPGEYK